MSDLFSTFCDSLKKENATTEILAYLLNKPTACRSKFLSLIGASADSADYEIDTQYKIKNVGTPDLVLCNRKNQEIILIENKPWLDSVFTTKHDEGDQLKRYADWLRTSSYQKKTLCLLAIKGNSSRLQFVPDDDITFVVITWEEVLDELETVCPENTVEEFLCQEFRGWFPRPTTLEPEMQQSKTSIKHDWEKVLAVVKGARNFAKIDSSCYSFSAFSSGKTKTDVAGEAKPDNQYYCGYYITDQGSGLTYYFGANLLAWEFLARLGKQSRFVLQVRFDKHQTGFGNKSLKESPKNIPEILKGCDFEYDKPLGTNEACEYVYPLIDSSDGHTIHPEKIADALTEVLNKVSEKIDKGR